MKRIAWVDRMSYAPPQDVEWAVLQSFGREKMPVVKKSWKRDLGTHVEICSEQFPGASPVWIWEEL